MKRERQIKYKDKTKTRQVKVEDKKQRRRHRQKQRQDSGNARDERRGRSKLPTLVVGHSRDPPFLHMLRINDISRCSTV